MDAIVIGDGPGGLSAGDGAAAIDILSTLKGEPVQDWDAPPENK
jgi:thioredoxin reductase